MPRFFVVLALLLLLTGCATQPDSTAITSERDIEMLISNMTLAEKVGQMVQTDIAVITPQEAADNHIGSIISLIPDGSLGTASAWRDMVDSYQRAMADSDSIPLLVGIDAVHGHSYFDGNSVILPHNIGIGATRNPDLARELAAVTARELTATGIHWTFSPSIAVARDIRWGRTFESFGEDVSLQLMFARPLVEGFQGDDLSQPGTVATTLKHFIADGATDGGVDRGDATLSDEELRRMHLPGFIDGLDAGSPAVMASFSSVNGEKVHGSEKLLKGLLKTELGFDGVLLTDWEGVTMSGLSLKQGIDAGIDLFMFAESWRENQPKLLALAEAGEISEARIDDSVRRILRMKLRLGLFDNPYSSSAFAEDLGGAAHREIARQAVRESLVLLKNENDLLPLAKDTRVFVTGSHADNIAFQCGGWTKKWQGAHLDRFDFPAREVAGATSILEGMRQVLGAENVVTRVEDADVVIVVVGETPYAEMFGDRKAEELVLSDEQTALIDHHHAMGKRVVTVLISGRPLLVNEELEKSEAFVAAWLPGSEGAGIADVLFGEYGFSGKLGFSWPRTAEQIPIRVGDEDYDPLFPFGYGLTTSGR